MPTKTLTPAEDAAIKPYTPEPGTNIWKAPTEGEPLKPQYLSPSSVKMYLACPLQYFYAKVVGLKEPTSVALHVGKAIHATLQSYNNARWRGEDSSEEAMQRAFATHFIKLEQMEGPIDYKDEEERTKARETAWNTARAYFTSPEALKDTEKPQGVEVALQAWLPGLPVPVKGIIDLVQGDLTVVDYKSAAAKPNPAQAAFDNELQLVTYQMMVEQNTDRVPPSLDLLYLVKTKTPQVIRVSSPPADSARKRRVTDLYKVAYEGITDERFHPQPGMQCSWCPYLKECQGWCR